MSSGVLLALAVFGACLVEAVEAFTLVLAAATSGGWRTAGRGAASAFVVLMLLVAAIGVPLVRYIPLQDMRLVIGALLLVLGLGWLRKAVLRASGHKDRHDEDAIYAKTVAGLTAQPADGRAAASFIVAFKGVLLEGLEVVTVVVSLGAPAHRLTLAAVMAVAAAVVVAGVGALLSRQLREVPENTLKFAVGVMLTSFGLFWLGEGAGLAWPGADAWLLLLIALFSVASIGLARGLGRLRPAPSRPAASPSAPAARPVPARTVRRTPGRVAGIGIRWLIDFFAGDAPEMFVGVLVLIGVAFGLHNVTPVAVPLLIALNLLLLAASTFWVTAARRNFTMAALARVPRPAGQPPASGRPIHPPADRSPAR